MRIRNVPIGLVIVGMGGLVASCQQQPLATASATRIADAKRENAQTSNLIVPPEIDTPGEVRATGDGDNPILDPLEVTACQYGGTYPECNPTPVDPYAFLNDCSIFGVCGAGGTWYWGPGGGGSGPDGGTFTDSGPFLGALTCLLGMAFLDASFMDVADALADVIRTGREAGYAERTYGMYHQQPNNDLATDLLLQSEMSHTKQAYKDAVDDLARAMGVNAWTAGAAVIACVGAFALPTP